MKSKVVNIHTIKNVFHVKDDEMANMDDEDLLL